MTTYIDRKATKNRKYQNGYHLKTTGQNHQIFDVNVWETLVHMCTEYEVSLSNPVPGGGVHRNQCQC